MVFGRKKKDEDLAEIKRQAVEKAKKLLEQAEKDEAAFKEATAATPVINAAEPPKMPPLPKFEVPNVGQYAIKPSPAPSPAPVTPPTTPPPAYAGLTDESIKELTERYGQFLQGGLNPLDAQYLRFLLLLAILDELRAIRAAQDRQA